jgi:superfamily II DNA helicase RecQ
MGDLIIKYLALVRPAEMDVAVVLQEGGDKFLRTCLFADMNGPWDAQRLRLAFQKHTYEWLGEEWYISEYRQAIAAFFHEHISDDPARDGYSHTSWVVDAQAGRSLAVGSRRYGNSDETLESMDPYLLEAFCKVSKAWHRLIGQESVIPLSNQFILPVSYSPVGDPQSIRACSPATRSISDADLLALLRNFFDRRNAEFKSDHQKEAVQLAISGADDLLVVSPTGAGKSLAYLLPLFLDKSTDRTRCTVLICPFISLTQDVLHRCEDLHIYVQEYRRCLRVKDHPKLNLLVVNIADAVSPEFWTQLSLLSTEGRLSRLVMDEAHVVLTDVNYRACFAHVSKIRRTAVPWLLLTATLAPKHEDPLARSFGLDNLRVLRTTTSRPNIGYYVREYKPVDVTVPAYDLARPIAIAAVNCLAQFPKVAGKVRDRIIVYCPTVYAVNSCRQVIDELHRTSHARSPVENCSIYHGRLSDEERKAEFDKWRSGKALVMVATKAFGTGVDYPHVRMILHYGQSDSLYDFAQQTGRAGRDGLPASSVVFWNQEQFRTMQHSLDDEYVRMRLWVTNTRRCRRGLLQWAVDHDNGQPMPEGLPDDLKCRESSQSCDICSSVNLPCDGTGITGPVVDDRGISISETILIF